MFGIIYTILPHDIPVITFSFSAISNRSFALPFGVYRYLVKPVTREKLILTINSLGKELPGFFSCG